MTDADGVTTYEEIWNASHEQGNQAFQEGHWAEAEKHFTTAALTSEFLWPQSPRLASSLADLGMVYTALGRHAEAERLLQQAVTIIEEVKGRMALELIPILQNYAALLKKTNRTPEAAKLERRIWLIQR